MKFRRKKIRLEASRYRGRNWYFLTLCTEGRRARLNDLGIVEQLLALLEGCAQKADLALVAYCFMPDHLHILVSGTGENSDLSLFVRQFKQRSGFEFKQRVGQPLWQRYFYDHILRPHDGWEEVASYIWMNPVRRGHCSRPEQWAYSGSRTLDWRSLVGAAHDAWVPPWKTQDAG